jgi:hypothetical protein
MTNIPPSTRSSLLIDLEQGKRIEVEALQGAAGATSREARRAGADQYSTLSNAIARSRGRTVRRSMITYGPRSTRQRSFISRCFDPEFQCVHIELTVGPLPQMRHVSRNVNTSAVNTGSRAWTAFSSTTTAFLERLKSGDGAQSLRLVTPERIGSRL